MSVKSDLLNRAYWPRFFLWSLLFLSLFELGIRTFVIRQPRLVSDPAFGGLVPEAGSVHINGSEGFGVTHFFEHGEIATPYQDGLSVIVLGDSFTAAYEVSDDEKFVSLAEQVLRSKGVVADLHNFGHPLRTVSDMIYFAPSINETYSPQVVILQVSYWSFTLSFDSSMENYFAVKDETIPRLMHAPNAENPYMENIISTSGLLTLLRNRLYKISKISRERRPMGRELDQFGRIRSADILSQQIVFLVRSVMRAYPGAKIAFLVIPNSPEFQSSNQQNGNWENASDIELIKSISNVDGVNVLYPLDGFQELFIQQHLFPRGFANTAANSGHLNRNGHKVIADALAEYLAEVLR